MFFHSGKKKLETCQQVFLMLFSSCLPRCCVLSHQLCQHCSLSQANLLYFTVALECLPLSPPLLQALAMRLYISPGLSEISAEVPTVLCSVLHLWSHLLIHAFAISADLRATLRCEETVCVHSCAPPARIPLLSLQHIAGLLGHWKNQGTEHHLPAQVCLQRLLSPTAG